MKTLSIFQKNLKTVSRNWVYFIILFVCPVLLILISGLMLNSNDFKNLKIGVVDLDPGYEFKLAGMKNLADYDTIADCLTSLSDSKSSICLYAYDNQGVHQIEIYIDNTNSIVEMYSKQFILSNIVSEQANILDQTFSTINSKITLYSSSIASSRVELVNASKELDDQEKVLLQYQSDLTQVRSDFNQVYYPLKNMQPDIRNLQSNLRKNRQDLLNNITMFRQKKLEMQGQITTLQNFLIGKLSQNDYSFSSSILSGILIDLDSIDRTLSDIESTQSSTSLINIIDNLDAVIVKLDNVKATLDRLDTGLAASIEKTRASRDRINYFISELDKAVGELASFSQIASSSKISTEFKNAFDITQDPVFLAFPLLISIIITFTSLVLSNMFILKQVNKPSYFRDIITPTWDISFIIADYLINLFFVSVQAAVLFSIGVFWFGMPISSLFIFAIPIFLTSSVFIFIGMSVAYLIKNHNLSMLLTIFFVMLLIIMSDLITPSVLSGRVMQFFISLNPFVILNKVLISILILHKPIMVILPHLSRLATLLLMTGIITYLSKKVSKEDAIQ
jgi:hypothetical protein